jgi:hypothetical protein
MKRKQYGRRKRTHYAVTPENLVYRFGSTLQRRNFIAQNPDLNLRVLQALQYRALENDVRKSGQELKVKNLVRQMSAKEAPTRIDPSAPRRGPGRPRKQVADAPRRGPGRPRKQVADAPRLADAPRRGPGRPRGSTNKAKRGRPVGSGNRNKFSSQVAVASQPLTFTPEQSMAIATSMATAITNAALPMAVRLQELRTDISGLRNDLQALVVASEQRALTAAPASPETSNG